MPEGNMSQEFRLKCIYETRNYLIEEINRNELTNKKQKKVYRTQIIFNTVLFQLLLDVFQFPLLLLYLVFQ